jgi:hypothetical protein
MSHSAFIKIWCDWPGCYARIETSRIKISEARQDAEKRGWVRRAGLVDLCGPKTEAERYCSDEPTWQGCATRTDHMPSVTTYRKGDIRLSCSCGWVVEKRYSWDIEGVVQRSLADYRWQSHVKDSLEATL